MSKLDANVVEFYDEKINVKKLINEIIKNLEIPIEIKNQKIIVTGGTPGVKGATSYLELVEVK